MSDSRHNVQKTIEKDTLPARCQFQMIELAAMVIEKAEHVKVSLLPRAGPFDSGNNQHLLLDCLLQHCPRDIIVEVRNRVADVIERQIEHLDPRRISLANPVLSAKYGGEQTLIATIHMQLNNLESS